MNFRFPLWLMVKWGENVSSWERAKKKTAICGAALETSNLNFSVTLYRFWFLWTAP